MSGVVAIVGPDRAAAEGVCLTRMLGGIASRGDRSEIWRSGDSVMAVARFDWELEDGFSGQTLVVNDHDVSVVADASLFYQDDLRRALGAAGVRVAGASPSHLIAAAYRAWGVDCPRHLEGDFAFVIYDHAKRRTFAARDFKGRRPLYYTEVQGALLIASTVSAIVAHPWCPNELDLVALAELVGVSLAGPERTPYAAVRALPAATSLIREQQGRARTQTYWQLRLEDDSDELSFDAASEKLRSLLADAITERAARVGPTAIWLSGGYDSPVMYGVGNSALDALGRPRLRPISFSYPVGDPGREDELIEDITAFWNARPVWLSIDDVPLLADAADHAAQADIPFQHAFENWLRALLGATRDMGSRVALYGDGGDQLFAVSTVFLHDLFENLRWRELRREFRSFGGAGVRDLWSTVMRPVVDERRQRRRDPVRASNALPTWMNRDFVERNALDRRYADVEAALGADGGGRAATETRRTMLNPTTPRVASGFSNFALEYGVEMRAPLFDQRVVEFAMRRPRTERASNGAVKHLLRSAAKDVLPPSVLAPRTHKTGVLTGYFAKAFRSDPDGIITETLSDSRLVDAGVIDGAAMQQSWHEYKTRGTGSGGHLFVAFQTELWLKAREKASVGMTEVEQELIRMPAASFLQLPGAV